MSVSKQIKNRIKSIESTHSITKVMEIVSTTKFRRFAELREKTKFYSNSVNKMISSILKGMKNEEHTFFEKKKDEDIEAILIIVMASDKGLCGSFNNNTLRLMEKLVRENENKKISFILIGKKTFEYCKKRNYNILSSYSNVAMDDMQKTADKVADSIVEGYEENLFSKVYLVFNEFVSALKNELKKEVLLPMEKNIDEEEINYIFDPTPEKILSNILPKYIKIKIYQSMLSNFASEHSARKLAMKNATESAEDMIKTLNIQYNKERQSSITQEISEIVSGAGAL